MNSTLGSSQFVYFGSYTRMPASKGICMARLNPTTGELSTPALAAEAANPTFLARHPTLPVLYATGNAPGKTDSGIVSAYKVDPATGALTLLNQNEDGTTTGTYLSVAPDGRAVFTAHYHGGCINSISLRADGALGKNISRIRHTMTGAHPQQTVPHPHCIKPTPCGRFALVADLSADKIFSYRISPDGTLTDATIAASVVPQAGARHLAFAPTGHHLYMVTELAATVTGYECSVDTEVRLREIQTVSIVPENFTGRRWAAEVAVHPSGRFLYASNRADDESIAAFSIDAQSGRLAFVQRTGGLAQPRHFAISPDGRWLVCANHDANTAFSYRIDAATGKLAAPLCRVDVPASVCVLFW